MTQQLFREEEALQVAPALTAILPLPGQTKPAARRQFLRKGPIKTDNPGIFTDHRGLGQRLTEKGAALLTERFLFGGKLEVHNAPLYDELPGCTGRDASHYTPHHAENQIPYAPAGFSPGLSRTI